MRRRDFLISLVAALCLPAAVAAVAGPRCPGCGRPVAHKGQCCTLRCFGIAARARALRNCRIVYSGHVDPLSGLLVTDMTLPPLSPSHLGSPLGRGAGAALTREETDHGD